MYFLLKLWDFDLPLWAYVLVGFCPRGFCPRGFCPRGFCPTLANDACTLSFPSLTDLERRTTRWPTCDEELVADDGVAGESSIIHIGDSDNDCPGSPVRPSS